MEIADGARTQFDASLSGNLSQSQESGSTWDVLYESHEGKVAARTFTPLRSVNHFWFSRVALGSEVFSAGTQRYRRSADYRV